jgi:hypothetical protein
VTQLTALDRKLNSYKSSFGFPPGIRFFGGSDKFLVENGMDKMGQVLDLNGTVKQEIPDDYRLTLLQSDGRYWVKIGGDEGTISMEWTPASGKRGPFRRADVKMPPSCLAARHDASFPARPQPDRLVLQCRTEKDWLELPNFVEIDLRNSVPTAREFSVPLPKGAELRYAAFSPSGGQIAWVLGQTFPAVAEGYLKKLRRCLRLRTEEETRQTIYVSEADGSGMRAICYSPYDPSVPDGTHWIEGLQWSPDGKQLSCIYRDTV